MRGDGRRDILGEPAAAWIALAAGVVAVSAHSANAYTVPVMMKAILAEMQWGRGEFAATSITRSAAVALSGFVCGLCTDRFGARAVLVTGALLVAAALVAFGAVRSLAELYLIGAVMGSGIGALGPIATSTLVIRRFGAHKGAALGLLHGGDNLLSSLIPRAATGLLIAFGWRHASWIIAGIYLLIGALVFVVLGPGEGRSAPVAPGARRSLALTGLPWRRPELYLVALVFLVAYAFLGAVTFHLVAYLTDMGVTLEAASATFGYLVLAGFFGSLAVGLGAQRTSALTMLLVVHGAIAMLSFGLWTMGAGWGVRGWAWLHGLAAAGYAPLTAMVMGELFGTDSRHLGATIGLAFLVGMLGIFAGNAGAGWGHDLAGTYRPVWQVLSAVLVLSLAPLGLLLRTVRVRQTRAQARRDPGR